MRESQYAREGPAIPPPQMRTLSEDIVGVGCVDHRRRPPSLYTRFGVPFDVVVRHDADPTRADRRRRRGSPTRILFARCPQN
jgi:hypothetical protein